MQQAFGRWEDGARVDMGPGKDRVVDVAKVGIGRHGG
jgi:hypothetical protein